MNNKAIVNSILVLSIASFTINCVNLSKNLKQNRKLRNIRKNKVVYNIKDYKPVKFVTKEKTIYKKMLCIPMGDFKATAYDLSVRCCGKGLLHSLRGITANGYNLNGLNRTQARTIAVDTKIIPMGSEVYIEFKDKKYNGIYTARDTGKAIKGKIIDLYMGDFGEETGKETINFGKQNCKIYKIIKESRNE